jgi:hypothetical protein
MPSGPASRTTLRVIGSITAGVGLDSPCVAQRTDSLVREEARPCASIPLLRVHDERFEVDVVVRLDLDDDLAASRDPS